MLSVRMLGEGPPEEAQASQEIRVRPATAGEAEFFAAVSAAASEAATTVVVRGIVGVAAVSLSSLVARRFIGSLLGQVALVGTVSFLATRSVAKGAQR